MSLFRNKKRVLFTLIGILLLLVLGGLVKGSFYFYNFVVERNEKKFLENSDDLASEPATGKDSGQDEYQKYSDWFENQNYETWTITSKDGLKLVGYYLKAKTPTDKTVILAHGYSSYAKSMAMFAYFFYDKLGYNILMPDARGHGESEGDYIGFGWPERKDYLQWIDKVIKTEGESSQIALYGVSMGGATVMMTSGEELPVQIKAIIEDCGYSSVNEELSYQMKSFFNLPSFPFINTTSILTKIKAGYDFYEASSVKQVAKDKVPMLFIHGSADTFVPTKMVYKVYNACKAHKELLIVQGAGHGMAYTTDKAAYEKKVTDFLGSYIK